MKSSFFFLNIAHKRILNKVLAQELQAYSFKRTYSKTLKAEKEENSKSLFEEKAPVVLSVPGSSVISDFSAFPTLTDNLQSS